ncbi:MAG: mechanosensitive ion channel [Acidobacteria bacterium]|nr:MAG: mechanosensitive ion channel [Acidobacteriota bacterium]
MRKGLPANVAGLFFALAFLLPQLGLAQDQPPQQPSQAPAEVTQPPGEGAVAAPTPLSEIARKTEQAEDELAEIQGSLAPVPVVEAIAEQLVTLDEPLAEGRKAVETEQLAQTSLRDLRDLQQRWEGGQLRVESWETQVDSRAEELESARDRLATMQAEWVQTREAVGEVEIPQELSARIALVVAKHEETTTLVVERLQRVLSLQAKLAEQAAAVHELLGDIEEEVTRRRESLFERDEAPVWELLRPGSADVGIGAVVESWRKDGAAVTSFVDRYKGRIVLQLLVFAALWALLSVLDRRSRTWTLSHEALKAATYLFRHPLASALLLSLMATRLIYPNAPLAVYDLNALLILVPLARLLPGMVDPRLRGAAYAMILVLALDELRSLFFEVGLVHRLLLLLVQVAALLILIHGLRVQGTGARTERQNSRWWRAGYRAIRLASVIVALALLANLVGRVSLADLLTSATLASFRYALVLFVGALVLDGLVMVLLGTPRAQSFNSIRSHTELLQRRGIALVHLSALYFWIVRTLSEFQLLAPVQEWLRSLLDWHWTRGTLSISLGDVFTFVLTIFAAVMISRFVRFLLEEDVYPRTDLDRGVPSTISMLVNYLIIGIGFFIALAAAGIDLSNVALLAGALGVGIGFGLQDLVKNFISGLILVFERPMGVGDLIEIDTLQGRVQQIGIRSSTIRTFDGAEVIIPNGELLAGQLVNWTLSDRHRRVSLPVGVAYGTDPQTVIEILLGLANDHPEVTEDPEPAALFRGFGDSALDFELRAWIADFNKGLRVSSELRVAINKALAEAGIEIPFPQRDVHVKSLDPAALTTPSAGESTPTDDK